MTAGRPNADEVDGVDGVERDRRTEWGDRPRCPGCGARVWLVVAQWPDRATIEGGDVVVTARCGFWRRGAGRCRQPLALVLSPQMPPRYVFPPSFEELADALEAGADGDTIVRQWGSGRLHVKGRDG